MRRIWILFLCCFVATGFAEEIIDSSTAERFPKDVSFTHEGKDYHLQCTGVSTRKKFFVKVYSVASYLQEGAQKEGASDKFQLLLQDNIAKELQLKWVHEAPVAKIQEGYRESFKQIFSAEQYAEMQSQIEDYLKFFDHDIQKGDQQVIRWLPGGYIEVIINGATIGHLTSKEFAQGLWSIWFGPKSVVDRNQLTMLLQKAPG